LTLPPRHRCPLDRMPASRLLLPRSGLERSDFVPWHKADVPLASANVRCWENKPTCSGNAATSALDQAA
jgi:hypothetical protein